MKRLERGVVDFLRIQGCVVVTTIDKKGFPHSSCKGIVKVAPEGRIYLLDVYRATTCANLQHNRHISITAFDEHKFRGYCLKGLARISDAKDLAPALIKAWEERITSRITQRLLRNIREEKGHLHHPEALLPGPAYLIVMQTQEVVDLTPQHLK